MKVRLIVHGIVQGVGYRDFVRSVAKKHGIVGSVRNVSDGSVEIVAVGDEESILELEKEIKVNERYGVQVMQVDRLEQDSAAGAEYKDFRIEKDRKL
jgi:acylphosphatase